MNPKNYVWSLTKRQKKSLLKKLSIFNGLLLVAQIFLSSLFFVGFPTTVTNAVSEGLCPVAVDVVLVIDRSGSMGYTSRCDWWQLQCDNKPSCTSYSWVLNTTYNQSQSWCTSKNQSAPHNSVWTGYDPTKIAAAQSAANSFLNSMGPNDQSSLVTFANDATLDKGLSNNHLQTKNAINNIVVSGATNIGDAISFGLQELQSPRANPKATKAMILLTDGKANKPNGSGSGENSTDVTYAINKANEAAGYGYKIFTVGLGSGEDINESMLEQIASLTGANYHHAPNGSDLSDIYDEIAWQVCQYGSISGCIYNDQNNNHQIDTDEPTLSDWGVSLTNGSITLTQTSTDGCYTFAGLEDGTYTISEVVQSGWQQTYPSDNSYQINISGHNDVTDQNFANYLPNCGNDIFDLNETCELGDTQSCTSSAGYPGIQSCNQACDGWGDCSTQETCGDGIKNGSEECDGTDGVESHYACTQSCTLEYIPWCGDLTINNNEECDGDSPRTCEINGYTGTQSCQQCAWGSCQASQYCGDGTINGPEICDNNNQSCTTATGYNGTESCSQTCDGWQSCQATEYCGDNIKNGPEECDGTAGVGAGETCTTTCTLSQSPICGDNIKNGTEECDDGNTATGDGCSDTCTLEVFPVCGNEILQAGEQCDDGNTTNGDGCSSTCQTETPSGPVCGNSLVESGEKCDSGSANGDHAPCSTSCTFNPACNDGEDNDDDGQIDQNDPGCFTDPKDPNTYDPSDDDEIEQIPAINPGDLIINEMMWMGSNGNIYDEWLELKNTTDHNIDLSACYLARYEAGEVTMFSTSDLSGKEIVANGYFLLSNFNKADSKINIDPDIYHTKFFLINEDLQVKLYCHDTLIDAADDADGAPLSGSNGTIKKSMSRRAIPGDGTLAASWCTANTQTNWDAGATELGTPGAVNSCPALPDGSLTIYNYFDLDGDLNTLGDQELATTTLWNFTATSNSQTQTATTTLGKAEFDLSPDVYNISEQSQSGWYLLGTNPTNQSVTITSGQTSILTFYHAPTGTIAGYKFQDLDGLLATAGDLVGQPAWLIKLFPYNSQDPIATTTTSETGSFEFKNLVPGDYQLVEQIKDDWQQLASPPSIIKIISGFVSTGNNFINHYFGGSGGNETYCGDNIKNNAEQCDGADGTPAGYSCTSSCTLSQNSSGGGGGNFGTCGNGIKEGSEVCDGTNGVPAGYLCNQYCTAYNQITNNNTGSTNPPLPPQNTEEDGVGGGPETPSSPSPGKPNITGAVNAGQKTTTEENNSTAGDNTQNQNQTQPNVLGVTTCDRCPWWLWPLLALLHLAAAITYILAVSPEQEMKISDPQNPSNQTTKITKGSWWWLGPNIVITGVIFLLLLLICRLNWLPLAISLGAYLSTMAIFYALIRSGRGYRLGLLTLVFLTIPPLVVYLACRQWPTWVWLLILLPYLAALGLYWLTVLNLSKKKYLYWHYFILILSALLLALEWLIKNCQCW